MIVGNGQLAQCFMSSDLDDVVFFASGVSNSSCIDPAQFLREKNLLLDTLNLHADKAFVYFSSCALSAPEYPKNAYYRHKEEMEELISMYSPSYYIFRVPQLFGCLKAHPTLVNFLYNAIIARRKFIVYEDASRYVIDIDDVKQLVLSFLQHSNANSIIDLANPYRYKITELVRCFEVALDTKAIYELSSREDCYRLNLDFLQEHVRRYNIDISFGENYFLSKISKRVLK